MRRTGMRCRLIAFVLPLAIAACSDSGGRASPGADAAPSAAPTTVATAPGDPAALDLCRRTPEKQGDGALATVSGGYETSQYDVAAWIDTLNGPSGPQGGYPQGLDPQDDAPVTLCFFDGVFAYSRPAVPDATSTTPDPHDREALLLRADGTRLALLVGPAANVEIQRPTARSGVTRRVGFNGAAFLVPGDWAVLEAGCRSGRAAVYVGEPNGQSCPGGRDLSPAMFLQNLDLGGGNFRG
ncbi:MAG: hypothetical protein QOJ67_3484 [Acidimicrobiaceae bacterium]